MVASDSTVQRVLKWLKGHQIRAFLLSFLPEFEQQDLLRRPVVPGGPLRRIGILDGSYMGGHWVLSLCLSGAINYQPLIRCYLNQGQELTAAYRLIAEAPQLLGTITPQRWLCDAKYFTKNTFDLIHNQQAHLLIKLKEAEYREVTSDAENLFLHFGGDQEASGFDAQRMRGGSSALADREQPLQASQPPRGHQTLLKILAPFSTSCTSSVPRWRSWMRSLVRCAMRPQSSRSCWTAASRPGAISSLSSRRSA